VVVCGIRAGEAFPDGSVLPGRGGNAGGQGWVPVRSREVMVPQAAGRRYGIAGDFAPVLAAARAAFAADCGYAAAMAAAAVEAGRREHAAALRAQLSTAARRAVSACAARTGEFTCTSAAACGTGSCRFASGVLAGLDVPAPPGRLARPVNHAVREGFALTAAAGQLAAAVPYVVAVRVSSADCARAADAPAA